MNAKIGLSTNRLLLLRSSDERDLAKYKEHLADPDEFFMQFGLHMSDEILALVDFRSTGVLYYTVFLKVTESMVGYVGIKPYEHSEGVGELEFHIFEEHRGNGYCTEASAALLEAYFGGRLECGTGHTAVAETMPENTYYLTKDMAMDCDADCGLFAWNGRSRGTFVDVLLLVALGKPATVVRPGCPGTITIGSFDDIHSMLGKRNPQHVPEHGAIPPQEQARCLDLFMPSVSMASYLSSFPMTKADAISMILGSPVPLDRKPEFFESASYMDDVFHEVADQVAELLGRGDFGGVSFKTWSVERALSNVTASASSFSTHRGHIRKALSSLRHSDPSELVYRKSVWDEQPDLFEEHEAGVAPFRAGDIVTLDCRPFAPLAHGLVLDPGPEGRIDCCYPRVLAKMDDAGGLWHDTALKHNDGLHMSIPGHSTLFKAEVHRGPLPSDEEILREVADWMDGDAE